MKVQLKYVKAYCVGGRRFYYFRRRGSPHVRLPGLPGSAEFMAAYEQALTNTAPQVEIGKGLRSKPGSISSAIAEYYQSQAFRNLTRGYSGRAAKQPRTLPRQVRL
jgi:hypothetical protein